MTGGIWLIVSGAAAFVFFFVGEGQLTEHVTPFLVQISVPMIAIGGAFVLADKYFPASAARATG